MNFFKRLASSSVVSHQTAHDDDEQAELFAEPQIESANPKKRNGRVAVYAVRVRNSFKGDILALQAELQLARCSLHDKARKVPEGEVMEFLLDTGKAALRNGTATPNQFPLANDVWFGVQEIARHLDCSPADAVERLVAEKIGEFGLLPKR